MSVPSVAYSEDQPKTDYSQGISITKRNVNKWNLQYYPFFD